MKNLVVDSGVAVKWFIQEEDSDDAFKIAVKYKRTFYDSLYLALSVRETGEFVTADEKFYNAVRQDFPQIILLSDWQ
jgi:predicted nucleic acid-binding protein